EARRLLEQAVEQQLKARRAMPGNPTYGGLLRDHLRALGHANLRLKDHAKAVEVAGRLAQGSPGAADGPYRAAWTLVRCVALAEHDPALSATRRDELARAYADQAVAYLREAVRR